MSGIGNKAGNERANKGGMKEVAVDSPHWAPSYWKRHTSSYYNLQPSSLSS